jgi:hypothetical protein
MGKFVCVLFFICCLALVVAMADGRAAKSKKRQLEKMKKSLAVNASATDAPVTGKPLKMSTKRPKKNKKKNKKAKMATSDFNSEFRNATFLESHHRHSNDTATLESIFFEFRNATHVETKLEEIVDILDDAPSAQHDARFVVATEASGVDFETTPVATVATGESEYPESNIPVEVYDPRVGLTYLDYISSQSSPVTPHPMFQEDVKWQTDVERLPSEPGTFRLNLNECNCFLL